MDPIEIEICKSDLYGKVPGGRTNSVPTVFVAFRMQDERSIAFRRNIQIELERSREIKVVDGKADGGRPWVKHIKLQIKKSKIIIADVTGPSREVIFEFGASGAKSSIPVVETKQHRSMLPRWLTSMQIPTFQDGSIADISSFILTKLQNPKLRGTRRPASVPGKVVWVQNEGEEWAKGTLDAFSNLCQEQGLELEKYDSSDLESFDDITEAMRAWLVIGCIDGGGQDYASHFLAGDIFARTMCGSGSGRGEKIKRKMIFLGKDNEAINNHVADSVKRVQSNLMACIVVNEFISHVKKDLNRHKKWISGSPR